MGQPTIGKSFVIRFRCYGANFVVVDTAAVVCSRRGIEYLVDRFGRYRIHDLVGRESRCDVDDHHCHVGGIQVRR